MMQTRKEAIRYNNETLWLNLPAELQWEIWSYCYPKDLFMAQLVCRKWKEQTKSDDIWHTVHSRFDLILPPPPKQLAPQILSLPIAGLLIMHLNHSSHRHFGGDLKEKTWRKDTKVVLLRLHELKKKGVTSILDWFAALSFPSPILIYNNSDH